MEKMIHDKRFFKIIDKLLQKVCRCPKCKEGHSKYVKEQPDLRYCVKCGFDFKTEECKTIITDLFNKTAEKVVNLYDDMDFDTIRRFLAMIIVDLTI